MEQRLRELLIIYSDNDMYADCNFISEVLDILVSRYGDNGVNKVVGINIKKYAVSDFEESLIGINLEYIKTSLLDKDGYNDKKSNIYLVNIYVILVLMHEFNHFRQKTKMNRWITASNPSKALDDDPFLDDLFIKSFTLLCGNDIDYINSVNGTKYTSMEEISLFYDEYHDCFAVERLAQLQAYKNIFEVITPMKSELGKVYYLFLNNYYAYKINEYYLSDDVIVSPIDLLLENMDFAPEDNDYDDITDEEATKFCDDIVSRNNLNKRIAYGLPITEKEYNDTVDFVNVMYVLAGERGIFYQPNNIKTKKKDIN